MSSQRFFSKLSSKDRLVLNPHIGHSVFRFAHFKRKGKEKTEKTFKSGRNIFLRNHSGVGEGEREYYDDSFVSQIS